MSASQQSDIATSTSLLQRSLRNQHIEQLRSISLPLVEVIPRDHDGASSASKEDLLKWIKDNKDIIQAAIDAQGNGGDILDWRVALLTLIENSAMILRKDALVLKAIEAAQNGDDDAAHASLQDSQEDIEDIARAMGLRFTVLCDLVKVHPQGHLLWCGAFSGVFWSEDKSTKKPLLGLAFKGTTTLREDFVDAAYHPVTPDGQTLYAEDKVQVHRGFYTGLFGTYKNPQPHTIPFELILSGLTSAANLLEVNPVPVHTTGHSLGGAYASLAYAEMLRRITFTAAPPFAFKDLYTLGGPRVGLQPLPNLVRDSLSPQQHTWRIVSHEDPVPTIPPPPWPLTQYPYVHYDAGMRIFEDKAPEPMQSEITHGLPGSGGKALHHGTPYYYVCIEKALEK